MIALFPGRFQPLHRGHLHAIKSVLKKFDKVVIMIGSINKSDENNPYSFLKRKKMLNAALKKYKNRYRIIGIADIDDNKWTKAVNKAKFDVVVTGNSWVKKCLRGFKTIKPSLLKPKTYNATRIRYLMKNGKKWQHLVPKEILTIIEY
ncbi:MAG: adenylyltransferase/cytidyltransferase family protein [Candidatus Aenigmatarchaeota archaeon]